MKDLGSKILSDIVVHMKYSRYLDGENRRETWSEICDRYQAMMEKKYPQLKEEISENMIFIREKKVLPSMRALQFAGKAIEVSNNRLYNCCFLHVDSVESFSETMYLLLGGSGVGFSVQTHHINKLPAINKSNGKIYINIEDSIEGWADTIKYTIGWYLGRNPEPIFNYDLIRSKGMRLITAGGKAPGPEPLKACVNKIHEYLKDKINGDRLRPLECHDLMCIISDAVISGGIRRSALISLFSKDEIEMLTCKSGEWWKEHPYRARANNSVVLDRKSTTEKEFHYIWKIVEESGAGEPGFYWTNNVELGTNPCCEISLEPFQFCNLTTINVSDVKTDTELQFRAGCAAFFGTLQAGFTDFKYLRPEWKKTTEKGALIGVSMTGIADGSSIVLDLEGCAEYVKKVNEFIAAQIGINPAERCTAIKPEGTASLVLGTSSGCHARHANFYLRRMRVNKLEAIYTYLLINHPELVEDCEMNPDTTAIITVPQKAPDNAIIRNENVDDFLSRVAILSTNWVKQGHSIGDNTNNVSATVSVKKNEWNTVGNWMFVNRHLYNGLSVLPYDDSSYSQMPFEDCTEMKYNELMKYLKEVDLTKVIELDDNTNHTAEAACAGGACELK